MASSSALNSHSSTVKRAASIRRQTCWDMDELAEAWSYRRDSGSGSEADSRVAVARRRLCDAASSRKNADARMATPAQAIALSHKSHSGE